mmetsp:Transcript_63011/g.119861  ORF Transcript_63011/g.119861 Transcript_63011/m.119861 type:complete len:374 (-) Transcript_63011:148-1269(-)
MGGPCDCDGRAHAEMDNFYFCNFEAEGKDWKSSEQFYQASKFKESDEASEAHRERIRAADPGMECYQLGNQAPEGVYLRPDWEEVKVDTMYLANFNKFNQNPVLQNVLVSSRGRIEARGGLFWKTWNGVLLERIREELRSEEKRSSEVLETRTAMMAAFRAAVAAKDFRTAEAVTRAAAKRELLEISPADDVAVEGQDRDQHPWMGSVFRVDPINPEANGQPHYVNEDGGHLFLGTKRGTYAWVLDEYFSPTEASGCAFILVKDDHSLPEGVHKWQCFDTKTGRHCSRALVLSTEYAARIINIFQKWDLDKDGVISREELEVVLKACGFVEAEDITRLWEQADANKDGVIDYREFVAWTYMRELINMADDAGV